MSSSPPSRTKSDRSPLKTDEFARHYDLKSTSRAPKKPVERRKSRGEWAKLRLDKAKSALAGHFDRRNEAEWSFKTSAPGTNRQKTTVKLVSTFARDHQDVVEDYRAAKLAAEKAVCSAAWWPDGRLIKIHKPGEAPPGGKREEVVGFSAASRKRLLEKMAMIKRSQKPPLFVTLTWPKEALRQASLEGLNIETRKAAQRALCDEARLALREWWRRFKRQFPHASAFWRLEIQPSRALKRREYAPHFHLLIYNAGFVPVNRAAPGGAIWNLQDSWNGVLDVQSANSVDLEILNTSEGAMSYAAKYLGKPEDVEQTCRETGLKSSEVKASLMTYGRTWGILGRAEMPFAESIEIEIEWSQAEQIVAAINEIESDKTGRPYDKERESQSMMVNEPWQFEQVLKAKDCRDAFKFFFGQEGRKKQEKPTNEKHNESDNNRTRGRASNCGYGRKDTTKKQEAGDRKPYLCGNAEWSRDCDNRKKGNDG